MRLSIIIPVLDSHEVFHRQCLHFERIGLPEETEIVIVDDDSDPPLKYDGPLPLRILRTHDPRPWTWALARNMGARAALGRTLLMYDLDHIVGRPLLDYVVGYEGQKVQFLREFAVLEEGGVFSQDLDTLVEYGWSRARFPVKGLRIPPHPNQFAMRADIFWALGGYREDLVERGYPQGEDSAFKRAWHNWSAAGKGQVSAYRPTIYVFPQGKLCEGKDVDYDPKGLFHKLTRKVESNHFYRRYRQKVLGNERTGQ
jgi:hypothetical protein